MPTTTLCLNRLALADPTTTMRPPALLPLLSAWLLSPASASASAPPADLPAPPAVFPALAPPPPAAAAALKGRFLHLTDLHPDPLYAFNASEAAACHLHSKKEAEGGAEGWAVGKGKGREEDDRAGYWGTPIR